MPSTLTRRALLATVPLLATDWLQSSGRDSPAEVVARFRRAYEALDELALEDVLSSRVTFEDPTFQISATSFDAMRPIITDVLRVVRSIRIRVEQELVCGAWVVARQAQTVVLARTPDRPITVRGVSLFRVEADRIAEWYDYYDAAGYREQAGGRS